MKSPRIKLMLCFLYLSTSGFCQNLVLNWSFEDTIPCISNPNWPSPESAPPWTSSCQSPDYFSEVHCGINYMAFGYQAPKTGKAFVGSGIYSTIVPNFVREIFSQQLTDSLIQGHKYCVSFYVSLAESSNVAVDRIGSIFTSYEMDPTNVFNFTGIPQVENPSGNIITDTTNWVLISGDFIAQGHEKYISIGNFYNDLNTQFTLLPWGVYTESYYYFDDISVIDCTVGINELPELNFSMHPNPVNEGQSVSLTFQSTKIETISILSVNGKLIWSERYPDFRHAKIELEIDLTPGVYFISLQSHSEIGFQKLIVLD